MKLLRLSFTINVTKKMKEDSISQLDDYDAPSVNNNTGIGLVISLCPNSNHLISLIPPRLLQILDIYSVVALYSPVIIEIRYTLTLGMRVFIKESRLYETVFYILFLQFNTSFKLQNKIQPRPRKTAIAQPPSPPPPNGRWPFCVTKVGMDVVPK